MQGLLHNALRILENACRNGDLSVSETESFKDEMRTAFEAYDHRAPKLSATATAAKPDDHGGTPDPKFESKGA